MREAAFGRQVQFERYLGYCVAAFTTTGYEHRNPHAYVAYGEPGRQIWRITLGEDATLFLLVFAEADPAAVPVQDKARQREVIARRYADAGWEAPEMLRALATASDLYVDRVSQIIMPHWTTGRVALVGDACACPSLLAGEGASMAMAEAYTLAGELDAAGGDHTRAFAAYERRLRPYVERKQKGAKAFANSFVPRTVLGLWARNAAINAATGLGLTRLLFRAQLADPMELGRYGAG